MPLKLFAIRGATTVVNDAKDDIYEASIELTREILRRNEIKKGEAVSLTISTTHDLRSFYPAKAVRESGLIDAPLFSTLEPDIVGAQKKCIRFMLLIQTKRKLKAQHVYLRSAKGLRPDLRTRTITRDKTSTTKALPAGKTRTITKSPQQRTITKTRR